MSALSLFEMMRLIWYTQSQSMPFRTDWALVSGPWALFLLRGGVGDFHVGELFLANGLDGVGICHGGLVVSRLILWTCSEGMTAG
jgi:hypothetical protein